MYIYVYFFKKKKKNYYCAFGLCDDIVDFKWCVLFHNFIDKLRTSEKVSLTMYIYSWVLASFGYRYSYNTHLNLHTFPLYYLTKPFCSIHIFNFNGKPLKMMHMRGDQKKACMVSQVINTK